MRYYQLEYFSNGIYTDFSWLLKIILKTLNIAQDELNDDYLNLRNPTLDRGDIWLMYWRLKTANLFHGTLT